MNCRLLVYCQPSCVEVGDRTLTRLIDDYSFHLRGFASSFDTVTKVVPLGWLGNREQCRVDVMLRRVERHVDCEKLSRNDGLDGEVSAITGCHLTTCEASSAKCICMWYVRFASQEVEISFYITGSAG